MSEEGLDEPRVAENADWMAGEQGPGSPIVPPSPFSPLRPMVPVVPWGPVWPKSPLRPGPLSPEGPGMPECPGKPRKNSPWGPSDPWCPLSPGKHVIYSEQWSQGVCLHCFSYIDPFFSTHPSCRDLLSFLGDQGHLGLLSSHHLLSDLQ
uniref:Uncharacterized protein n=1 Tax=Denticeps clupeoides TaxID=299321 RepID=A0AAY4AY32_9TELE